MLITWLFAHPLLFGLAIIAAIVALTLHEFAHAAVATLLGDSTAKEDGRLSLNPFAHLDVVGFALLLMSGFGWAKPVPFNPYALRTRFGGTMLIPLSGPAMNALLAIITGIGIRILRGEIRSDSLFMEFLSLFLLINIILGVFNLLPIVPLDGGRALLTLLPDRCELWKVHCERMGPFILILLLVLDGWQGTNIFSTTLRTIAQFVTTFSQG